MPRATEPPKDDNLPEWGEFQLAMLNNAGYQKISNATSNQVARSRFEVYCSQQVENWPVAAQLWELMIGGLPKLSQPFAEEIRQWNEIAQETNMPFVFDKDGLLKPETSNGT